MSTRREGKKEVKMVRAPCSESSQKIQDDAGHDPLLNLHLGDGSIFSVFFHCFMLAIEKKKNRPHSTYFPVD